MPVSGTIARAPKGLLMVWVAATALPSPSATVTWVVWGELAAVTQAPCARARVMSIPARRAAAYSGAMRRPTGTSTKVGSPVAAARSAKAILRASAIRWKPSTVP
jgi:hypothetical protein